MIKLPNLPYAFDALEPHIDAQTMEIHHDKHHQGYINNLMKALEGLFPDRPLDEFTDECIWDLIARLDEVEGSESLKTALRNNGGGHINHSLFWKVLRPQGGEGPKGELKDALEKTFGSLEAFQKEFNEAAAKRFGSGWAFLVKAKDGSLSIVSTPNQDSPITSGLNPILALDVWEHAYYLKYQNKRPDYINAFWNVVNWEEVERLYLTNWSKKEEQA
ncbi:Manganese superoxide dismutase [Clostridiaceae bacterium JG1575]|nr:Manganese superoxide dismutase [Clostridiaceae bacterium JG1575]